MYPPSIQKLIEKFAKFPTVGPRTAARFVFYLLGAKDQDTDELLLLISGLKQKIKLCSFCFNPLEGSENLCEICANNGRDKTLLCVVEKEADLAVLEKTKKYKGIYFILGGTVSNLRKEEIEKLRINNLLERLKNPETFNLQGADFQEIILAMNPTPEGEATALYLERQLKPFNKKITRLGRGLPVGGELEYADEETLENAISGRK